MMEQQGPADAQHPDRLGQLERRMSGVEGQLRGVSKQISVLTWSMGLGFTVVLVVVGWMWSSVTSDIGALRRDVVDLPRAFPATELRLTERIHSLERQLSDRIHSLELAFTRAGIEFGPLPPGQRRSQAEPEPGSGPAEEGAPAPDAPQPQEDDN